MADSVQRYVSSCELCQRNKYVRGKPAGLLHPLEIPARRWTDIRMDFMTQLPQTRSGYDTVIVIVDRLTKRGNFLPTRTDASTTDTARLFCDLHQRLHGLSSTIVSDRDPKFTSKLWEQIMILQGTQLRLSTAFRPSTDGQSEVTIKLVNEYIRHFISPHHDDWDSLLALAEFAYNSRIHASIGMSPFMADLGYQPRSVADCVVPVTRASRASKFVTHQQAILAEAQDAMAAAQGRWHVAYDRNSPQLHFNIGDFVLLSTQNLALAHLGTDGKRKFAPRYIGPYKIIQITGPDTFKLALPPGLRLHSEYHVSRLRPYVRDDDPTRTTRVRPVLTADGFEGHLVDAIINHRRRTAFANSGLNGLTPLSVRHGNLLITYVKSPS
ncbi:unnamed protein product [Phytophthora fragariaefolia]|uniref:Unnamed protein product n=1 Tax=Phytophthora fragariaefolia TaxID=1490495 RepID=A0A9W6XWS2_9STRA|nr:unnamed protein product [Phytophthora fragariaefolia]